MRMELGRCSSRGAADPASLAGAQRGAPEKWPVGPSGLEGKSGAFYVFLY